MLQLCRIVERDPAIPASLIRFGQVPADGCGADSILDDFEYALVCEAIHGVVLILFFFLIAVVL